MLLFYLSLIESEDDRASITRIYESYLDWMLKMAFYYLKNESDAEDTVNDVFLNIIRSNASIPLDDERRTKAYLFICIKNSALKLKRKRNKHRTVNLNELLNISAEYNIEAGLIQNELLKFIDTMPDIYKNVLALKIVFNKSAKEIADVLHLPLKTTESRIQRGTSLLKERFGDIDI